MYLIFLIAFEVLVSKKKTQKLVIFFFKKNVFVVTFVKKFKFIYLFEVSWIRTNDGTTNRFTVCRFNHSAITSNIIKKIINNLIFLKKKLVLHSITANFLRI